MQYVLAASLLVVGVIHLLPLAGVLGADRVALLALACLVAGAAAAVWMRTSR